MFRLDLQLPARPGTSFFLWSARQTGKCTPLREELEAEASRRPAVLDEIQKIPGLLGEVHWLIENRARVFVLCGSSARKVRRSRANLLGGRAVRRGLLGLVSAEIGTGFDLVRAVNRGFLAAAALCDGAIVNFASIARECAVSAPTVRGHFQILEDALLARFLPAWRRRPKRRTDDGIDILPWRRFCDELWSGALG